MRECRASYPDCRATGRARMIGVFVTLGGQDAPIHATGSYEALIACWKFVSGEQLVEGKKW
jgi:hypothetical protein